MRWRWPPLNWCGIAIGRLRGHADACEHLVDDVAAVLPRPEAVDREALCDERADLHARVERADGVLEDDLHVPSHLFQVPVPEPDQIDAVEPDLARGRLEQAQDRAPQGRLAAAGLPDEAERLAAPDVQIDAVHGLQVAGGALEESLLDREVLLQAADAKQHIAVAVGRLGRGLGHRRAGAHDETPRG